jgi:hypothetical protein
MELDQSARQHTHAHEIKIDRVIDVGPILCRPVGPSIGHALNKIVPLHFKLNAFIGKAGARTAPVSG